ncbi:hypothetical protein OSB04_005403 [Centaurea solstitialis]|uniref:Uncharacterized protein n=1 Tax=Centaurea solstitialis TaxID=347529 RepID=A0AA38U0L3_9ASTR|nr:hypothetical protein OSB04_005403 [Centaurea solstitialis]
MESGGGGGSRGGGGGVLKKKKKKRMFTSACQPCTSSDSSPTTVSSFTAAPISATRTSRFPTANNAAQLQHLHQPLRRVQHLSANSIRPLMVLTDRRLVLVGHVDARREPGPDERMGRGRSHHSGV